jgi:hypothetical protein
MLDTGIAPAVRALRRAGVPTYESCEGGPGHAFLEPTVRFRGNMAEGFAALATAINAEPSIGLGVYQLRRVWRLDDGEPTGPWWDLVFRAERNARTVGDRPCLTRGCSSRCCSPQYNDRCRDRRSDHSVALSGKLGPSPSARSSLGLRGLAQIVRAAMDRLSTVSRSVQRSRRRSKHDR